MPEKMKPYILNRARKELLLIAQVSLSLEVNEKQTRYIASLFSDMSSWGSKLLEQPYSFSCVKEVGGTYSNGAIQVRRRSPRHIQNIHVGGKQVGQIFGTTKTNASFKNA